MKKWFKNYGLLLVLFLSIISSFGGTFLSAYLGSPDDGGRGGALAVALALFCLFATRNYGAELYKELLDLTKEIQESEGKQEPETVLRNYVEVLEARLNMDARSLKWQNYYLAFSTGIGTIFWGFDDWFAAWIVPFVSCQN